MSKETVNALGLPSFLILGPPRTGTTWLHGVLASRTNLPEPTKETRFFDNHFDKGLSWYEHHYPQIITDRPTGEVAPTYFSSPEARERIAQTIPNAKVVIIFREPIQRLISLYRVKRAYGMLEQSFEEALDSDPELLESSKYATHLRAWQQTFPQSQILVTFYEDLRATPQQFVNTLSDFLNMKRFELLPSELNRAHSSERMTEPRNMKLTRLALNVADWCKARKLDRTVAAVRDSSLIKLFLGGGAPFKEVSPVALEKASEIIAPEIEELEEMTGRDLSDWKQRLSTWNQNTAEVAAVASGSGDGRKAESVGVLDRRYSS